MVSTLTGLTTTAEVFVLRYFLEGFSWGIFLVLCYLILWGEFDKGGSLYYSIGLSTFHFSRVFGFLVNPFLSEISISMATMISAMLIFISVMPLIYARETLPVQYKLGIVDLNKYVNRIKKEFKKTFEERKS